MIFLHDVVGRGKRRVDNAAPGPARRGGRDRESERFGPGVHGDVDVAVDHVGPIRASAVEAQASERLSCEKSGLAGSMPCQTISGGMPARSPLKNVRRRKTGWALRRAIIMRTKRRKPAFFCSQRPVDPADRVILAPRVVIAVLGAEELVAAQDHRHALREHQGRHQVPHLAAADRHDVGCVGRPLDAAVPAPVGVVAVAISLAVGLVVLVVVRDQVVERESVVATDDS